MKINSLDTKHCSFGSIIKLPPNNKALFYMNLEEMLYNKDIYSKKSVADIVEQFAEKHGIKAVNLRLLERASEEMFLLQQKLKKRLSSRLGLPQQVHAGNVIGNNSGDLLVINCGPKTTTIRFDNSTSKGHLSGAILGNIQENYNIING